MGKEAESLLIWYAEKRRDLPWRKDKNPYHISLSEIMLQQTRIPVVINRYETFLKEFPNWEALSSASEDRVLKLWEGLGYYSRARNLHKAAKLICADFGGQIPQKASEIAKLPGFGAYTSAAIASICFGEKAVSCDGNLARVYARLSATKLPLEDPQLKKAATAYFLRYMNDHDSGAVNQALMEVGETLCLPNGNPLCNLCPLASFCKAKKQEKQLAYPLPKSKLKRGVEKHTVLALEFEGKFALEKREKGLLSSLYGFPMLEGHLKPEEIKAKFPDIEGEPTLLGTSFFSFTHKDWDMACYKVKTKRAVAPNRYYSLKEVEEELSLPSAFRFVVKLL